MVKEINMAKWIVALRSGAYKQGERRLQRDGQFCCLGVACDVSGLGSWTSNGGRSMDYTIADKRVSDYLPDAVKDWLGVESVDPALAVARTCTLANDCEEWSFAQIADGLESKYLPGKKAEEILAGAA